MQAILLYLIHGVYPNKLYTCGNIFANIDPDRFRLVDLKCCSQIEEGLVGVTWVTLPRLPMSVYINKNYTLISSRSYLFIQILKSCQTMSGSTDKYAQNNFHDHISQ